MFDTIQEATQKKDDAELATRRTTEDFLRLAQERFKQCADAEAQMRKEALDDLEFSVGHQWPSDIETQRQSDGRPCLTMNRAPQFLRQVTNEQRQQRPGTVINPAGDNSDVETAEILQGTVRHIEVISDAEIAYDTAFDSMARCGIGFWRILTEYAGDNSFDQEIKIKRIKNPFTVYFDPNCVEADKSDARFAFLVEDLSAEEFKNDSGDSTLASLSDFSSIGDQPLQEGLGKDRIRIAEYFYVEELPDTLLRLADGTVATLDDYEQRLEQHQQQLEPFKTEDSVETGIPLPEPPPEVLDHRQILRRQVKWAKINAREILEQRDWPGKWIPIIPLLGDDLDVNGRRHVSGLLRHYKDPQRMYNYWISATTETIALAPKSPYIAAEGQLEGHEEEWRQANVRNLAVLTYKPRTVNDQPAPPPQRQQYEPPIQAMSVMIRQADNDMKATTGIYDASLGQHGPDESGKAILARQKQTDVGTLNFTDNLARSMRHSGRVLIDLIPRIYDAPRIQRILRPDGSVDHVGIFNSQNGISQDEVADLELMQGVKKIYDVGVGRYDVIVSTGPSYQSKRQEAAASMMALVASYPPMMQAAGDLLVRNMDWPGAKEIADRLKKTLSPQLIGEEAGDPQTQAAKLQAQLSAITQQQGMLVQQLNHATEIIRSKRLELESKERIAALQAQVQLLALESEIRGDGAKAALQAALNTIQNRTEQLHANMPINQEDGES